MSTTTHKRAVRLRKDTFSDELGTRHLRSALLHLMATADCYVTRTELGRSVRVVDTDSYDAIELLHYAMVLTLPIPEPERSRASLLVACGYSVQREREDQ